MYTIKINKKTIGEKQPCFIIAEAGINHNGKLLIAKKLVDAAVNAGADAIKFQTYKSEGVVTSKVSLAPYAKKNIGKDDSQISLLKRYELSYKDFIDLKNYCDKKNIIFLSTPHSFDAIDFLAPLVPCFKIGSGDLTNLPFIKKVAQKGKPVMLGTGMATLKEVQHAVNTIRLAKNNHIVIMHCTTNYPVMYDEVNLNAMVTMKKKLGCLVGYSDHTLGYIVPILSVGLGAVVIEKHFTLDRTSSGPDHKASLEPNELKIMIQSIRDAEKTLGDGIKKPTKSEKKIAKYARKSIVAQIDIKKGTKLAEKMLTTKRPGTGINPNLFYSLIGKKVKKDIKKDELLNWKNIE